jgi:predicted O-methyltransferase YrrM
MYKKISYLYGLILLSWARSIKSVKFRITISFVSVAILVGLTFITHFFLGIYGIILASALPLFVGVSLLLALIHRLDMIAVKRVSDERAMQALTGIYRLLSPTRPLPYFRNAALSTDTILDYIHLIEQLRPKTIVELGSGSSTIVAAYQLKKNGNGRVIALDHDERWGGITSDWLMEHELTSWAEVRIAPLEPAIIDGKSYKWYKLKKLEDVEIIDLLLIDGPPDIYGLGLRYPGLHYLATRLGENGVIVVDDCIMPRWKDSVVKWARENAFTVESRFLNEKDTLFLRRVRSSPDIKMSDDHGCP